MSENNLPGYVEFGGNTRYQAPFTITGCRMYNFVVAADASKVRALFAKCLNAPSGGAVDYRPVTNPISDHTYLLFSFVDMKHQSATEPSLGWIRELEFTIFALGWDFKHHKPGFFIPYIYVDSDAALIVGREGYGFPKRLGRLTLPSSDTNPRDTEPALFSLDTLVIPGTTPDTEAAARRLIEISYKGAGNPQDRARTFTNFAEMRRELTTRLFGKSTKAEYAGEDVNIDIASKISLGVPLVFLKQFRDSQFQDRACYQSIVTSSFELTAFRGGGFLGDYDIALNDYPSAPIREELGLISPIQPEFAFYCDMDFVVPPGDELRRANIDKREKVAILGGGMASLTAAFELTKDPNWKDNFESITVYQLGWRLGGKGASGRGQNARIEEHGLHLWLGFYENAFRLIRECYAELDGPLAWDDAFKRASFVGLADRFNNDWTLWTIPFPEDPNSNPGDPNNQNPAWDIWEYVEQAGKVILSVLGSLGFKKDLSHANELSGAEASSRIQELSHALDSIKSKQPGSTVPTPEQQSDWLDTIEDSLRWFLEILRELSKINVEAWRAYCIIELCRANTVGIIDDELVIKGFAAINQYDYREWLKKHGADPLVVDESVILRGLYDLVFAYQDGNYNQPMFAAGEALRSACRIFFTYKGAIFWKMQAGMGDIVFTPLYQVLKKRGVQFRFFHRVKNLGLSADSKKIATIEMARQVTLYDEQAEYQPLVQVGDLLCWPAEPLYGQLREGAQLRENSLNSEKTYGYNLYNLESFWTKWQDVDESYTLEIGKDFDRVVLGISLGSLPYISHELVNDPGNPKWKLMVEKVKTVQTQSFQVWLSEDMNSAGWGKPQVDLAGYVKPFNTWADMRQLIQRENWPAGKTPQGIAYFCDVMPTPLLLPPANDSDFPIAQGNSVKNDAISFLRQDIHVLWPKAMQNNDFQWNLLVGGGAATGDERFASQFWRANIDPSERYVQSVPYATEYRIKTAETGYSNLYIAGDWIDCGFNVGCIEAAVIAGMQASNAISGSPELAKIIGYKHP